MSSIQGSDDYDLAVTEEINFMGSENMEKSMTNLNVNLAGIAYKVEEMGRNQQVLSAEFTKQHEEFCLKFQKQQELLLEEIKLVRLEHAKMRKIMNRGF